MLTQRLAPLWRESIAFFAPTNLCLFCLATLNNAYKALLVTGRYFWWLMAIVVLARVFRAPRIENIGLLLLFFFLILAVRPSVERKDGMYFLTYINKLPAYLLVSFIFFLCWFVLGFGFASGCSAMLPGDQTCSFFMLLISVLVPCLIKLSLLFLLDLNNSGKNIFVAVWNSLKFCFYFLPVMIILVLGEAMLFALPQLFSLFVNWQVSNSLVLGIISMLVVGLIRLLTLSMVTLYYVKVKYQHHKLFFQ